MGALLAMKRASHLNKYQAQSLQSKQGCAAALPINKCPCCKLLYHSRGQVNVFRLTWKMRLVWEVTSLSDGTLTIKV
jgi:hypothetical protein